MPGIEAGSLVPLHSLAGYPGTPFLGRVATERSITLNGSEEPALNENSRRICALISIRTSSTYVFLYFGANTTGSGGIALQQGDSFQIDSLFPWTGIVVASSAGAAIVDIQEISVP